MPAPMSSTPEIDLDLAVVPGEEAHDRVLSGASQHREQHQRQAEAEAEDEERRKSPDRLGRTDRDHQQGHQEGPGTGQRDRPQEHAVDVGLRERTASAGDVDGADAHEGVDARQQHHTESDEQEVDEGDGKAQDATHGHGHKEHYQADEHHRGQQPQQHGQAKEARHTTTATGPGVGAGGTGEVGQERRV